MAKSQETFSKKEKEKKRQKKKEEKQRRKEERKANKVAGNLENMMAYIDENGNIVDTPPDQTKPKKIDASQIEIGVPKKSSAEKETRRKGRVEFFNDSKGFGFIKDSVKNQKYFVHVKSLKGDIREGDIVTFDLAPGLKGFDAVDVSKA